MSKHHAPFLSVPLGPKAVTQMARALCLQVFSPWSVHFWGQHCPCLTAASLSRDLGAHCQIAAASLQGLCPLPPPPPPTNAPLRAREGLQSWTFLRPDPHHKASLLHVGLGLHEPALTEASEGKEEAHLCIHSLCLKVRAPILWARSAQTPS